MRREQGLTGRVTAWLLASVLGFGLAGCGGRVPAAEAHVEPEDLVSIEAVPGVSVSEPGGPDPGEMPEPAAGTEQPGFQPVWEVPGTVRVSLMQTDYPVGTGRMTAVIENLCGEEIGYGSSYACEKFEDGEWVPVEFAGEVVFPSVIYTVGPRAMQMTELSWEMLGEPLGEGLYRVTGEGIWAGGGRTEDWRVDFRVTADALPEPGPAS